MKQDKRRRNIHKSHEQTRRIRDEQLLRKRNKPKSYDKQKSEFYREYQEYIGMPITKKIERQYLADYIRAVLTDYRRPIAYDYMHAHIDEDYSIKNYSYEINKARYLADPANQPKLVQIATNIAEKYFGTDVCHNYGVPHSYKLKDLPKDKPSKRSETFLFPYDDEYRDAMLNAVKVPLGDWELRSSTSESTIKTRKYIFNVGGDILIGELTVEKAKNHDNIKVGAGSDIKFCVYYKGREDGKFILDRWDFEPTGAHYNKKNPDGSISLDGYLCPHTKYGHRHLGTLANRLFATHCQSVDICPTPINQGKGLYEEEARYETVEDMLADFEKTLCLLDTPIPAKDLAKARSVRDLGKKFCDPYYPRTTQEETRQLDYIDYDALNGLPKIEDYLPSSPVDVQAPTDVAPVPPTTDAPTVEADVDVQTQDDGICQGE